MKYLIALLIVLLIGCDREEKILSAIDGDTIVLSNKERVRIAQIDCPERSQQGGKEAKAFVENTIAGKEIIITRHGKDKYGRSIGSININGQDLAHLLVVNGFAHITKYTKDKQLIEDYEYAKANKKGLFASNWILPSQYRSQHKK